MRWLRTADLRGVDIAHPDEILLVKMYRYYQDYLAVNAQAGHKLTESFDDFIIFESQVRQVVGIRRVWGLQQLFNNKELETEIN